MIKILLILLLSLSLSAFAGVIKPKASYFNNVGEVTAFEWAPERYASSFRYDILYYIPQNLKDQKNVKTLIFMHGGGSSTQSREGSLNVTRSYVNSTLVKLANDLNMIIVAPSASGLNWGGHTIGMIRDLNHLMRKEINLDHNNIGLSGHSMGGMGIGRSFPLLADEFAYFVPMAAGIDPVLQTEDNLNKVFNVPYVHLQGLKDHFKDFITRCQEQTKRTLLLEEKYKRKSLLEIIYYDGAHNHDYNLMKETIARLQQTPRNIFQDTLYGSFHYNDNFYVENNIQFHQASSSRYFWMKMIEASGSTPERLDFTASIKNNVVNVTFKQSPKNIKRVRVYLSKKMLNRYKKVKIFVNGILLKKKVLGWFSKRDGIDPSFVFEDHIDIVFNNEPVLDATAFPGDNITPH